MLRNLLAPLFTLVLAFGAVSAQAVEVQRVITPKGIEAWLVEDHTNPILAVSISFKGGTVNGKPGLAVMTTSLMDEGAGPYDSLAFQGKLEDLSIGLGFSASRQRYSASLSTLTKHRDEAFSLLRLALTEPRFDAEPVERVRAQLLTSLIREAQDPSAIGRKAWSELVFAGHPYAIPAKGTAEDLKAITAGDMKVFAKTQFAREGMIIGVSGDITASELAELLDRTLADLPATAPLVDVPEVALQGKGKLLVVEHDFPQSTAMFTLNGIKRDDPDFYAASVMNYILGGGGFSSWLTEEVREKKGLAYSVSSGLSSSDKVALWSGSVGTQNARMKESLDIIKSQLVRMRDTGPTAEDLKNAKTYLTGSFPLQLDSTRAIAGLLVGMQEDDLGIDFLDKRNGFIEAVTLEDIARVSKRLLDPNAMTIVVVGKPQGLKSSK